VDAPAEREAGRDRSGAEGHALTQPKTRALSWEEIEKSADLQRRYVQEYGSMLRVVADREVAKEAARVNVSALAVGLPRIVPHLGRYAPDQLREAIGRGSDLVAIQRVVARLVLPEPSRLRLPRSRDVGPER
jgi:hypothetical protein